MPSKRLKIIKRIDWKKLNIHDDINEISLMIVKDIRDGIMRSMDINDKGFAPLSPITIKLKGNDRMLYDTGLMQELPPPTKATKANLISTINVAKARGSIGMYHNEGGNKGTNPPQREWYGIGKRGLAKIRKFTAYALAEKLKRNK